MSILVANARMYSLGDATANAWRALFDWISERAGIPLEVISHPPPHPLADLWRRQDLGCALMCGYPWTTWRDALPKPVGLAAPVPSVPELGGDAHYRTHIVVRDDSTARTLADLRGVRFAYTARDSQSGYQAARALFAPLARAAGGQYFESIVGPLVTPRAVVEAIVDGSADAGPLDAWWHALLRMHEPALARRLRVIALTPLTPLPPMVCSAGVPEVDRAKIAGALMSVADARALNDVRAALLLTGFAAVDSSDYAVLAQSARAVDDGGYRQLK